MATNLVTYIPCHAYLTLVNSPFRDEQLHRQFADRAVRDLDIDTVRVNRHRLPLQRTIGYLLATLLTKLDINNKIAYAMNCIN